MLDKDLPSLGQSFLFGGDMAEYGIIYKKFWNNPKTKILSDDVKLLWLYLLSSPHSNCSGFYVISKQYIISDLKWDNKKLEKAFSVLIKKNMIKYDEKAETILIPSWFEYNKINSKNQLKKAKSELTEIPKTQLAQEFNSILDEIANPYLMELQIHNLWNSKSITYENENPYVMKSKSHNLWNCKSIPYSETETETETEAEKPDKIPFEEIIKDLNEKTGKNFLTDKKKSARTYELVKARINEGFTKEDFFKVHSVKSDQWLGDEKMEAYLRPSTLYRVSKFADYLGEYKVTRRFTFTDPSADWDLSKDCKFGLAAKEEKEDVENGN